MEMEDNLLQQLMMTQTTMTEQMRQMQQTQTTLNESLRQQGTQSEALFQKEMMAKQTNVNQAEDNIFENSISKKSAFQPVAEVADNLLTSRSFLLGAEAVQQKNSDTRQKVQMGALNAVGGAAETATSVGSFLVPGGLIASTALGLGAGAAVSYGTKQMITGAKDALNYQDILEEKGYKAFNVFEGKNDFGGIGLKLDDQQELSSFMRDLEPEKLLNSKEMSTILEGALDGKLLKSSTDLKSFKKKFSEIVDTVKEVSVVMNTSLEEATKMMGELESRGIGGGKATMLAAQAKVNASILGVDAKDNLANNFQVSSELSQGSGIDQAKTMGTLGTVTYVTTQLMSQYKNDKEKEDLFHYIKNNGGEQVMANRGTDVIMNELGRNEQTKGLVPGLIGYAAEFDASGSLTFNKEKIAQAARGELGDAQSLAQASNANLNTFSAGQKEQFVNTAAEEIKQNLSTDEMASVWRSLIDQQTMGDERKRSEVLVSMGVAKDSKEAEILTDQIYESDQAATNEYTGLSTREALNAVKRVNSPGVFQQAKGTWAAWVTNPLGDIGQAVSDEVGDVTLSLQKAVNNVDSKEGINSKFLLKGEAFTDREEFTKKLYSGEDSAAERFNTNIEKIMKTNKSKNAPKEDIIAAPEGGMDYLEASRAFENPNMMKEDMKKLEVDETRIDEYLFTGDTEKTNAMTQGEYQVLINRAKAGSLSVAEVTKLKANVKDGAYGDKESKAMVQDVVDVASGDKKVEDLDQDRLMKGIEGEKDLSDLDDGKKTVKQIRKDIEKKMDKIGKETKKATNAAKKQAMKLDLSEEDAVKMDRALRQRDYEAIEGLTNDKDMLAAAEKMKKAEGKLNAGREASGALAQIIDNTAAKSDVAQSTVDLMVSSKAMTKKDAQMMFDDVLSQRKAIDKGIKGGWSLDRIQKESKALDDMMDGKMSSLSEEESLKFAQGISNLNDADAYTVESFKSESGVVDRTKLTQAMESIVVAGATKDGDAVKAGSADKALGEHTDAMGKMLETVTKETAMMKKATKNLKNGTQFQYSSVTGK